MAAEALIGGGLAALGSIGSSAISSAGTRRAAKEVAKFNKEQWYREIAYNDPSAQMARLRAANLNPHLVYGGSGSSAAGNSSVSSPDMPMYQTDVPNFVADALSAYQAIKSTENQTKNTESEIAARDVQNKFTIQQTLNKAAEYDNIRMQGDLMAEQIKNVMENTTLAKLNQIALQIANTRDEEERKHLLWRYEHEKSKGSYDLDKAKAELYLMGLEGKQMDATTRKVMAETDKLLFETGVAQSRYNEGTDRLSGITAAIVDGLDKYADDWKTAALDFQQQRRQKKLDKRVRNMYK